MQFKDYYKTLNISENAEPDEIKKTYRKLAKIWHPDRNEGNKESSEKFKEIVEAYEVLSDPIKRKNFDELYGAKKRTKKYNYQNNDTFQKQKNTEYSDFFKQFFSKKGKKKYSYLKGNDMRGKITISLYEAYFGSTRILNINSKELRLKIKPGVENNTILKITGMGKISKFGGQNGDLFVRIIVNKDNEYIRNKNDLTKTVFVDIFTAILGDKLKVKTFKKEINISVPQNFDSVNKLRIKGFGMPIYNNSEQYGDLYLDIRYKLPKKLREREIKLLKELQKLSKY